MRERSLDEWRALLWAERARVRGLVESLGAELETTGPGGGGELASYDQHPADTGSETFEREKDQTILAQLRSQIEEIDAALARIDAGTYGIDEETGEPIDPARLDAVPTARSNVRH